MSTEKYPSDSTYVSTTVLADYSLFSDEFRAKRAFFHFSSFDFSSIHYLLIIGHD